MNEGRIKCYFQNRGYGYIECYDGQEVYFALTAVEGSGGHSLIEGATVYFEAITTGIGLEALRVRTAA